MNNTKWKTLLSCAAEIIGEGERTSLHSKSWCSWTTYSRILNDAQYWSSGIPKISEILNEGVCDGGTWGQPFRYDEIAHLIIPAKFVRWGKLENESIYEQVEQPIQRLSSILKEQNIEHVYSEWAIEIRQINGHS